MRRPLIAIAFTTALSASTAMAGWPEWKHKTSVDYVRNNSWPQPFRTMDANSVVAPFEVMKDNGWRDNNTIGSQLFNEQHAIGQAGMLKLQWILTHAPSDRKVIYVKTGKTPAETRSRVESVQLAVSEMIPSGPLPEIQETTIEPSVSSGSYQDQVHRALSGSTPLPRLPRFTGLNAPSQQQTAPTAGTGGGGGGGGAGGGGR